MLFHTGGQTKPPQGGKGNIRCKCPGWLVCGMTRGSSIGEWNELGRGCGDAFRHSCRDVEQGAGNRCPEFREDIGAGKINLRGISYTTLWDWMRSLTSC